MGAEDGVIQEEQEDLQVYQTLARKRPFKVKGRIDSGVELIFEVGKGYKAADFDKLLVHFRGKKDVLLGPSRTDPPVGSLGHFIKNQVGVNHASYLAPILVKAGKATVGEKGRACTLDFT